MVEAEKRPGESTETPEPKRAQLEPAQRESQKESTQKESQKESQKGFAPIKPEFIIESASTHDGYDDERAEGGDRDNRDSGEQSKRSKKGRGQNKKRDLKQVREEIRLCSTVLDPGSGKQCTYGEKCKNTHDVDLYLASKPSDIPGDCPVFVAIGYCPAGIKCRWLGSHYNKEKKELGKNLALLEQLKDVAGEVNKIDPGHRMTLSKNKYSFEKAAPYIKYLDSLVQNEANIAKRQEDAKNNVASAAEAIARETTHVSELNLNCGCPIDLLYRQGQGSALLDQPSKMVRILNGMNACSGDIPVTVKIRTGTKDNKNTASSLVSRVLAETHVAAITLHGRSRQQRYTREADWNYIADVAKVVQDWNHSKADNKELQDAPPTWFVGNGDCYTFEQWHNAVNTEGIDSVMVARGALIKPWIFEEVDAQQYLDKSASERLEYMRQYAAFAVEHWGSDEYGIENARRYMCEFIGFTHRYIPVGILERLPPKLNERPPKWREETSSRRCWAPPTTRTGSRSPRCFWARPVPTSCLCPSIRAMRMNRSRGAYRGRIYGGQGVGPRGGAMGVWSGV
ncbi:hypothetical protein JCM33374_g3182 [Metschnikowia sp. JCM 33374]|nr:hypothetical protein JCM33374_g3182 [Metschnikowia sp. JCM 33374]